VIDFVYLLLETSHAILPSEEIHRLGTEFVPKSLLAKAGHRYPPRLTGKLEQGDSNMVTRSWKSWMLGALLGAGFSGWVSESAMADPPRGHVYHRGATINRNGIHHGHANRYVAPNHHYQNQYRYGYGYGYGHHPHWGYQPPYHCLPHPGVPHYGYPSRPVPGVGISIGVGSWPSGPSFGGGAFPSGPSFGAGGFRGGR
jgi:hypothetical protein